MNFFKKRKPIEATASPSSSVFSAGLPRQGEALPVSLKAHSQFIKRVNCSQCGAPKSLPSTTAYIYCDYCGALMDYDFRIANADTNAGLTNTVYHRIYATVQGLMAQVKARGDRDECRRLYRQVYTQWLQECPTAASPRAYKDAAFRDQFIAYQVECFVEKDFDTELAEIELQMQMLANSFQRIPTPGGAWRVVGPFWQYAELFTKQMEKAYDMLHAKGIDAMDPDKPPPGVPLRMEYSCFCQAWLPHLSTEDGEKLLTFYGLSGEYFEAGLPQTESHKCGSCGSELHTMPGARQVVCDSCGYLIDVCSQAVRCQKCGALLSFPVSANHILCPYCGTDNRRV
jgi:DNA-directed RNA polymerase subunit RPC12/RpoP